MDHAVEAERLGYDGFAVTEHHFWYDGYCPSLLPVLAAIAQRTTTIRLLSCALLAPLRNPLRLAEEIAVLDHLSRGRLTLMLGYGYRSEEFEGFGLSKQGRGSRFSEIIEILRLAFGEQAFSFSGKYYNYDHVPVYPKPLQHPNPPLWLAGGGQTATARRAGRLGISYCVAAVSQPFARVKELIDEYHDAAAEAKVAPGQIAVATDVAIAETSDEVDRIVKEDLLPVYAEQLVSFGFIRDELGNPVTEIPPEHPIFQVLMDSFVLGTPDEVIERIKAFRDLGCDVFVPRLVEANFRSDRILREIGKILLQMTTNDG
jgi:alkanesulfonate monooxygenase SsuD/methylene tetrahydromethanopterin reductase-like flavin-dependent oxidoreductase (luciferase family)